MQKCYFELRTQAARGTDSMAADMMRHLHTRQYLGKTLVISDDPFAILSIARKQWLRVARAIQKQRASTLNADKILKYTHTITHMQHMRFTLKQPEEFPAGDVFFLHPRHLLHLPAQCFTIYTDVAFSSATAEVLLTQLPAEALIVDYNHTTSWAKMGLQPKSTLEAAVTTAWEQALHFLADHDIVVQDLQQGAIQNIHAMDEALDVLLGTSHAFMQVANAFQRALELGRPLRLTKDIRQQYDTLTLLAHRVQALSPGAFTQQFLEVYNEDDSFFLFESASELLATNLLAKTIAHHQRAGRHNLAQALLRAARPAYRSPYSPLLT